MTKQYKICALLGAGLWLTLGCTADHETEVPRHDVELHFTAATVGKAVTRSDAGDFYNDALPSGSDIGVYIYGYDNEGDATGHDLSTLQPTASTPSKTWVYATSGSAITVNGNNETYKVSNLVLTSHNKAPTYPEKTTGSGSGVMHHVNIFAVFPNNTAFKPSENDNDAVSYDFTALLDQTSADNIKASDLLTTNGLATYTKEQTENVSLRLTLEHQMAKVHVTFVPKTGSDLTVNNMPTSFKVNGVYRKLQVSPVAGTVTLATSGDDGAKTTTTNPLLATTGQSFFIPPQVVTLGDNEWWLQFDIRGSGQFKGLKDCTFRPSGGTVTLVAGHSYEVTVTVDVDFASVTGTITTWNTETMSYDTVVL